MSALYAIHMQLWHALHAGQSCESSDHWRGGFSPPTCVSNLAEAIVKAIGSVSLADARASISSHPKLVLLACLLRGTTSPEPDREMGEVMMPFVLAVAACRGCVVVVYARVQYCIGPRYTAAALLSFSECPKYS